MEDNRDVILRHLVNNPTQTYNQTSLKQELFPELSEDEVERLLQSIINYDDKLMRCYTVSKLGFIPVAYKGGIDSFLEDGGFTSIYKTASQKEAKRKEKDNYEFRKVKAEAELSELNLKDYNLTKWFARIGFGISVVLGLIQIIQLFL